MENKKTSAIVLTLAIFIFAGTAGYFLYHPDLSKLAVTLNRSRASDGPTLSFQTSNNNPAPGEEFIVDVFLDTGNRKVSASELHIKWSANLEAISYSIANNSLLPIQLPGGYISDSEKGGTIILGSEPDNPRTANGTTLTFLKMKAISSGDAQIEFGSDTKVAALYSAGNVLAGSAPLGIFIGNQSQPPSSNPPSSGTLTIQSESLPQAWVNGGYSQSLVVSGGPSEDYVWDFEGALPPGFSISKEGVITGVATSYGTFNFSAIVKSGGTQVKKVFEIIVRIFTGGPNPPAVVGVALSPGNNCSQANCHYSNPETDFDGDALEWISDGKICRSKLAGSCPNFSVSDDQGEKCGRTTGPTWDTSLQRWYSLYYACRNNPDRPVWSSNNLTCTSGASAMACPDTSPTGCNAYGPYYQRSDGKYGRDYNPNNPANCNEPVGPQLPNVEWRNNYRICYSAVYGDCPSKNPLGCSFLSSPVANVRDGGWERYYYDCTGVDSPPGSGGSGDGNFCDNNPGSPLCEVPQQPTNPYHGYDPGPTYEICQYLPGTCIETCSAYGTSYQTCQRACQSGEFVCPSPGF